MSLQGHRSLCMSHKYFKDAKSDADQKDFEIKLSLTYQAQSTPKQ